MPVVAILAVLLLLGMQDGGNYLQPAYDYLFTDEERAAYDSFEHQWDRDRFWNTYWEQRDPTPETKTYNELQELFFSRVDRANLFFSRYDAFEDGWKSDMGHVYIMYGAPKEIYRSPAGPSLDPKYEVWVFNVGIEGENKRTAELIFEDVDDGGNFVLLTQVAFPYTIQEEKLPEITHQAAIAAEGS